MGVWIRARAWVFVGWLGGSLVARRFLPQSISRRALSRVAVSRLVRECARRVAEVCPPTDGSNGNMTEEKAELSSEERSDNAKALANEAFKAGDYKLAIKKYGFALKHAERAEEGLRKPDSLQTNRTATVLANRCMAHMALDDLDAALMDAAAAVKAAPGWPKAHFRHGTVLMKKGSHTKAYAAFKQGWHLDTSNEELTKACQQAHQAMMGFKLQDKVMSQEELFKMRSGKLEEQWQEKTEKQKALLNGGVGSAPLMAAAPGAPVADQSYREEALKRTAKMANPRMEEDIAAREKAARDLAAERAAEAEAAAKTTEAATATAPAKPAPAAASDAAMRTTPATAAAIDVVDPPAAATEAPSSSSTAPPEYAFSRTAAGEDGEEEEQLVLSVRTPLVSTMKELDLSVGADGVELTTLDASVYAPLVLTLPAPVDANRARAKFDKKARVLTVKLPIVGVVV